MRRTLTLIAILAILPMINGCAVVNFLTGTKVVFQDDFGTESSWGTSDNNVAERTYVNQTYAISVFRPDWFAWGWAPVDETTDLERFPADFTAEVEAWKSAGPAGQYGIIWGKDNDNYHMFKISTNGFYALSQRSRDEWQTISSWQRASTINGGSARNHLVLKVRENTVTLKVNGQVIHQTSTLTFGSGNIGLFAGTFEGSASAPIQARFDNFTVTTPRKGIL